MELVPEEILRNRNAGVDILRAVAIIFVLLFHFDKLFRLGFIGVDLFFVISGYLVSRFYMTSYLKKEVINWKEFLLKRVFKILPSYYFFLFFGSAFAYIVLKENHPDQIIPLNEFPKYIFFYANYDLGFQWSFELIWSLCVEEHFYIFLTLLFLLFQFLPQKNINLKLILFGFIALGFALKTIGHYYKLDTYAASHMRVDALFLGVLVCYQEVVEGKVLNSIWYGIIGFGMFAILTVWYYLFPSELFSNVYQHTLFPISFCFVLIFMINRSLDYKFFKPLRILAYYSYNLYLWHALVAFVVINQFKLPFYSGLLFYLSAALLLAFLSTKIIEEPFMALRRKLLSQK